MKMRSLVHGGFITCLLAIFYLFCGPETPDFDSYKKPAFDNGGKISAPADSMLIIGEQYYLTVKLIRGKPPLLFKWRRNEVVFDSTAVDSVSFTLKKASAGTYSVLVSNSFGQDSSSTYNIKDTALFSPKLLNHGEIKESGGQTLDSNYSLWVRARGADILKFQWFRKTTLQSPGTPIAGKIDSTINFKPLSINDTGYYYV